MKLGETLLQAGKIDAVALQDALQAQRYRPKRLGRILRDLDCLDQAELNLALSNYLNPKRLTSIQQASEKLKERISEHQFNHALLNWAKNLGVTVFDVSEKKLTCFSESFRDEVIESAEEIWKKTCELILIEPGALRFIRSFSGLESSYEAGAIKFNLNVSSVTMDEDKIKKADPYTSLFCDTILGARQRGASDIHIQPTREGIDIRFRVNGDMITWKTISSQHRRSFINEVKRLTNLSIAVSGRPQDGRVSFESWKLDLRASLLPSQFGEKTVLRLLDMTRSFDMTSLGLDAQTMNDLKGALRSKNGLVIISGPTGSGKTTTLYTLLSSIDRKLKNIITLEDPIEYGIKGLTQVQISPKLSFAAALRCVLRQDPDVILVGEIRDAETADLCVKAASTGHLVLSTIHANGAPEVIGRLLNLGVDPFLLRSVLRFSSAQRLAKRLCPICSISMDKSTLNSLLARMPGPLKQVGEIHSYRIRNAQGCSKCSQGIVGRVSILEYMKQTQVISFLDGTKTDGDLHLSVSLKESYLRRAEKGEVDINDLFEIQ